MTRLAGECPVEGLGVGCIQGNLRIEVLKKKIVIPSVFTGAHEDTRCLQIAAELCGFQQCQSDTAPGGYWFLCSKNDVQVRAVVFAFSDVDSANAFRAPCDDLTFLREATDA